MKLTALQRAAAAKVKAAEYRLECTRRDLQEAEEEYDDARKENGGDDPFGRVDMRPYERRVEKLGYQVADAEALRNDALLDYYRLTERALGFDPIVNIEQGIESTLRLVSRG